MNKAKFIAKAVFILTLLVSIQGYAQTTKYSLDEIKKLIPVIAEKELIESIEKGCVLFKLNNKIILELGKLGASEKLIDVIGVKYCNISSDTTVQIEYPSDGGTVPKDGIRVRGTYIENCPDDIWVFIWPELAPGTGWPQSNDAKKGLPATKEDGGWNVFCYFGGPPQNYKINVYTASASASRIISNALRAWAKANDYPGLLEENLPKGLVEKHSIRVEKH